MHYLVGAGGARRSLFQPHANPDPDGHTGSSGPNRYADGCAYSHGDAGPYCYARVDRGDPEARVGVWSARSP